jgi:hypothetical protein
MGRALTCQQMILMQIVTVQLRMNHLMQKTLAFINKQVRQMEKIIQRNIEMDNQHDEQLDKDIYLGKIFIMNY